VRSIRPKVKDGVQTICIVLLMGYERIKSQHAGAKNGGGAWMTRADAKATAKRQRRQKDRHMVEGDQAVDEWSDLDEFSARASTPTLRRLDEDEAAAGFSWGCQISGEVGAEPPT
jgi:hypothetical protein